jgi:hypothetical protein
MVMFLMLFLNCVSTSYNVFYHAETEKFAKKLNFDAPELKPFSVNGAVFHPFSNDNLDGNVVLVVGVFTSSNDYDNIELHSAVFEYFDKKKTVTLHNNDEFVFTLKKDYRANNDIEFYYCGKIVFHLDSLEIDKKKPMKLSLNVTVKKSGDEKNEKLKYLIKYRKDTYTGLMFD